MITNIYYRVSGRLCGLAIVLALAWCDAYGTELSPVGLWKTIDDNTGKPRGLIRITEINGEYQGKIEKVFPKPGEDPNPRCDECDGEQHNKPVVGMTILWGLKKDGDEYQGGKILDPENGNVYQANMKLVEKGKKLNVRGFIGFSIFGRTQTWQREE